MSSILTLVKGGLLAGLGLGVSRLVSLLPVMEQTEEDLRFQQAYPGIVSQRDLSFAIHVLLEFKMYAPTLTTELLRACEHAVQAYLQFMSVRNRATEAVLCEYPPLISDRGAEACDKADRLSLRLLSARSDLEQEVANAVEIVKKTMDDLLYNAQQELDVLLD